ncbi:hypothetical protein [Kribbella sp. NPDC048915]|uniref:hypothetical protein n=1 Tax=Kribbella sp. NPDC048915 TaxID=3155148 RepID=UPI0033C10232
MNPAQLAMAYQACEVADLAAAIIDVHDPEEAAAQAAQVLAAARQLVTAANRLSTPEPPTDPLQRFAHNHPAEAATDIHAWQLAHRGAGLPTENLNGQPSN